MRQRHIIKTNGLNPLLVIIFLFTSLSATAQEHQMSMHKNNMHAGKQAGGHHGGGHHGAMVKGVDKFPTSAYQGSPVARDIAIVKLPKMQGNAHKGKQIAYNRKLGRCLNCHILGEDGHQAGSVGPNLSNFSRLNRSDDYTFQQIWDARAHNPKTVMPPMGTNGLLSKHQVLNIVAYLKTLKHPVSSKTRPDKSKLNVLVADRDFTLADEYIEQGKVTFDKKGKNSKSCASCHNESKNSLVGVAAKYPKKGMHHKIINLEQRINLCRTQKMDSHPFKLGSPHSNKLSSYVKYLSRDAPIKVATTAFEKKALKRGETAFNKKTGQLNLSCADCHATSGDKWLSGQYLSSITPTGSYKSTAATWPRHFIAGHDLGLISLQQRIRHCQIISRTYPLKLGSQEYSEMELYITSLANGSGLLAPTKSNLGD